MAITSSAKKAIRVSDRKRAFNLNRKINLDKKLKEFKKLVSSGDKAGATKIMPDVYQVLDKAAKNGYIKQNTASRIKSRLTARLAKVSAK